LGEGSVQSAARVSRRRVRSGRKLGLDALIVGYYEGKRLHFAAKVRAGLTPHQRRELLPPLERSIVATCPFVNLPNARKKSRWNTGITAEDMLTLRWVSLGSSSWRRLWSGPRRTSCGIRNTRACVRTNRPAK
jgi:hypothetical protein